MKTPPLRSFRSENFKAICDSGTIKFGWLTALIGNNGSGKSSLIEALETFRDVVVDGLDPAMRRWRGFEHAINKSREQKLLSREGKRACFSHPMSFRFHWQNGNFDLRGQQTIAQGSSEDSVFIQEEKLTQRRSGVVQQRTRNDRGEIIVSGGGEHLRRLDLEALGDGESLFHSFSRDVFERWRFLMLNPENMGRPQPQQRAASAIQLAKDGANVAEYLQEMRDTDVKAFDGLLDAMRYVLPYARDLQPTLAHVLGRQFYLRMKEQSFDVPGWLLSTGTLRIVAILACLRHPKPPPLLVIEEIENGLDPRTLHLVVEEIRAATAAGTTQVILTTHSPYLLDLLDLSHIVVVERDEGQPVFRRPDVKQLAEWSKSFAPGRLYTMGRLTRENQ